MSPFRPQNEKNILHKKTQKLEKKFRTFFFLFLNFVLFETFFYLMQSIFAILGYRRGTLQPQWKISMVH